MKQLRPYQVSAIEQVRDCLRQGGRPVLSAPTGSGKTRIASEIFVMARMKNRRTVFTVPFLSLINQTYKAFVEAGIDEREIGVIQANNDLTDWSRPVQIASLDTLARRPIFPQADLIIFDECHKNSKVYERWMNANPNAWFVGLSATPWSVGMDKIWNKMIIVSTVKDLIDQKYLSPFKYYAPSQVDLSQVKIVAGDYQKDQLADTMTNVTLISDIVTTWIKKGEWRPTFCFAVNRKHAAEIQNQFIKAGVPSDYIDAFTPVEEREAIVAKLRTGEIKIVCNVGTMTTGVDAPFVSCIILARPTKSEMLYQQIIGRGLRTDIGKDNCIAKGSKVLTDKGLVNIEDVTLDHKVWDGVDFVNHSGAVCKGTQAVIEYDNIIATPDHKVMTNEGWKTIEEASRRQLRVAITGVGRVPIRFFEDSFSKNSRKFLEFIGRSRVFKLLTTTFWSLPQYEKKAEHSGLSALQWTQSNTSSKMALPKVPSTARQMSESEIGIFSKLRWSWDKVQFFLTKRSGSLDSGELRYCTPINGVGSNKQQWPLRAEQFAVDRRSNKHIEQQKKPWWSKAFYIIQKKISSDKICRQNFGKANFYEFDRSRNNKKVEQSIMQTEREVWDILNAGRLQRFTVNGRLVHNCVILDHSNTGLELGRPDEIYYDDFVTGKSRQASKKEREKKEKKPRLCPSCHAVVSPKVKICECGHHFAPPRSDIEIIDGELVELGKNGKIAKVTFDDKQSFYSGVLWIALDRNYSKGWAAHTYKKRFGVWPRNLDETPQYPAQSVLNFVRSKNIAYAKAKEKSIAVSNI